MSKRPAKKDRRFVRTGEVITSARFDSMCRQCHKPIDEEDTIGWLPPSSPMRAELLDVGFARCSLCLHRAGLLDESHVEPWRWGLEEEDE